jgi:hypothetical protein
MGNLLHKAACPQYIKDVFHKSRVPFSLYPVSNRCAYYSRFEGGGRVPAVQPQIGVRAMTASGLRDPARSACRTGVGRDVPTPVHLHRVWYTLAHPSGYVLAYVCRHRQETVVRQRWPRSTRWVRRTSGCSKTERLPELVVGLLSKRDACRRALGDQINTFATPSDERTGKIPTGGGKRDT